MTRHESPLKGKRLLIVEEALKDPVGHWYEYVRAATELCKAEGAQVIAVGHRDLDPAIAESGVVPLFARTSWDGHYAHPQAWRRYLGIIRHNWLVYRTMSRFVQAHGPFDGVFAPTVVIHHIAGWRLLMARHGGRSIRRMVLLFRNNAGSYDQGSAEPRVKKSAAILGLLMRSFAPWLAKGKVEFATDSTRLAAEYRALCGIEPVVYPSPRVAAPEAAPRTARDPASPVTFSCLGPARFEKGIDVLQAALRRFLESAPDANARFVIQWNADILDENGVLYEPDPGLEAGGRVAFIRHALDSQDYDAAVAATDVMLLPYRRESYFARISGVAVEAVTAGMPVIYTRDTWCEELVRTSGAGVGVANNDPEDLQRAIEEALAQFEDLRAEAIARADLARLSHSGQAFLSKLWGLS